MIATHAAAGAHVTNGDSHNHAGGDGAQISHDGLSGVSANDHHAQSHTVASHSDTTATGTELNALTDGSNADALHAHASEMALVHADDTEHTTSSTTEVDVVDVTGLNIPADHGIRIEFNYRLDNTAGSLSHQAIFGLHLNGSSIIDTSGSPSMATGATNFGTSGAGNFIIEIPPRSTGYLYGGTYRSAGVHSDGLSVRGILEATLTEDGALPSAAITSITIRGLVADADLLAGIKHLRVWQLAD
jgi:hypothetical protein